MKSKHPESVSMIKLGQAFQQVEGLEENLPVHTGKEATGFAKEETKNLFKKLDPHTRNNKVANAQIQWRNTRCHFSSHLSIKAGHMRGELKHKDKRVIPAAQVSGFQVSSYTASTEKSGKTDV